MSMAHRKGAEFTEKAQRFILLLEPPTSFYNGSEGGSKTRPYKFEKHFFSADT